MKTQLDRIEDLAILRLSGEIKMGESAAAMVGELENLLGNREYRGVILDLEGINYIDSTGLGEMVGFLDKFKQENQKLKILNPSERVLKLIKLTRLDDFMDIHDDETKAIASFSEEA